MTSPIVSSLRDLRLRRGWSQSHLGDLVGTSRQSVAAIESGRSVPSTEMALRLARALGLPVNELFRLNDADSATELVVEAGLGITGSDRVRLARMSGRLVAHGLGASHGHGGQLADGVGDSLADGRIRVRLFSNSPREPDLVVAGCDPAFGLVQDHLRRDQGLEILWLSASSSAALDALSRGSVHVAGIHLRDPDSGQYNGPSMERRVPFSATRFSYAVWEQVVLLERGNPLQVRSLGDLARPSVRFLNREPGSGSRSLLEFQLSERGIPADEIPGFQETAADGHEAVGAGIASGAANAGVAIRAVGGPRNLSHFPLAEEPYDLVIPSHLLELPAVDALLAALRRPALRRQIEALGGYDASMMGRPIS